ncbi:hypothetical protein EV175_004997 [Coemansia sp. RSA 1933]|nr:hypothetical protein EV175_004997 [Coemansia sp. RSA 1933]
MDDESRRLLLATAKTGGYGTAEEEVAQARVRRRGGWVRKCVVAGTILCILAVFVFAGRKQQAYNTEEYASMSEADEKVRVELFVMSRCPDAALMEKTFSSVVDAVHPIMDVQLSFIATLDPNATTGAVCKHGENECRGNIDELCALKHRRDLLSFWRFLNCLNAKPGDIGKGTELALRCASAAGLDAAAFLACTSQTEGRTLFKQSVENALFAGVSTSATVYIAGKKRCVEDSGWRECDGGHDPRDFIRDICAAYKGTVQPPSVCAQFPPHSR